MQLFTLILALLVLSAFLGFLIYTAGREIVLAGLSAFFIVWAVGRVVQFYLYGF